LSAVASTFLWVTGSSKTVFIIISSSSPIAAPEAPNV
jgi:hypothetical protein